MNASLAYFCRWSLAAFLVFGTMHQCETFQFIQKPPRIVRVVEGTRKSLIWDFTATASKYYVIISRQRPGETVTEQIATRRESTWFTIKGSYSANYIAWLPATLQLINVQRSENYVYTLSIFDEFAVQRLSDSVTVEVVVPPKIIVAAARDPVLDRRQNYTLKCNASGDPRPNITWTKDGVPVNQFNVSGYFLHLVNVQRKDAGSYRCTASNGYGMDATSVSIVGIKCYSNCADKKVTIRILNEDWKDALTNQASVEFITVESKLLSAIWSVYAKNPDKELFRADVNYFRSGSVLAFLELLFGKNVSEPLRPLQNETSYGKLGPFIVDRTQDLSPTTALPVRPSASTTVGIKNSEPATAASVRPTTSMTVGTKSTETATHPPVKPTASTTDARGPSGLTNSEKAGIIGGCIGFGFVIAITVIFICYIYRKRKNSSDSWTQMTEPSSAHGS